MQIDCQDYKISIGAIKASLDHFLENTHYSAVAVLVDQNTRKHCLPLIIDDLHNKKWIVIEIPAGEEYKNLDTCSAIWKKMLINGFDRHSLLINLGGGVIGDMGGFCASTSMRGIDFIHIPTTLLSQVDSSVGGKLGVDLEMVKNMVGVFASPKAVLIDRQFLKTLDERQIRSGFAEMVKHGLIADASLWRECETFGLDPRNFTDSILHRSISIKKSVVERDPKEKGLRKILNFGHTVGHAVETVSWTTESPLLHGEAIFVGMVCEVYLAYAKKLITLETRDYINKKLKTIFYRRSACDHPHEIFNILLKDKKNRQNQIYAALINGIGSAVYEIAISKEEVLESFLYYQKL